jgi:tetratricopeptide (TPR) repeat protein
MSLERKYRKWESYDVDEAIENVDVAYRKNTRSEERKNLEVEASRSRKIEADILTARERVRELIVKTGRLRDRRRDLKMKKAQPPIDNVRVTDTIKNVKNTAKKARERSGFMDRAISERDRARSFLRENKPGEALASFISALRAADSGGAIRRDVGHRHVPLDWDVDSVQRSQTWDEESRRHHRCCDDPSHNHHHHHPCRHQSKVLVKSLSAKDQLALNNLTVDAMIGSARCCLHLKQYLRTIEYLTPVLEQDRSNVTALLWRGEAFLKLGSPIIARHHLNRCDTLEESRDWKAEISVLRKMIESSEEERAMRDDADVDDFEEEEEKYEQKNISILCDDAMTKCENNTLRAGIMLDAVGRLFEREAFYKSALDRYCASLRLFQDLSSNSHSTHTLRHRISAHLSVARCSRLRNAQCTFSAKARNMSLSHCESAQVLIRLLESGSTKKSVCSCNHHQVHDIDLDVTAALLRSQLLAEGSNFADAIAVLKSFSSSCSKKKSDDVEKMIDRVKYLAAKHGKSLSVRSRLGRELKLSCTLISDDTIRLSLPEMSIKGMNVRYYRWCFKRASRSGCYIGTKEEEEEEEKVMMGGCCDDGDDGFGDDNMTSSKKNLPSNFCLM